MANERNFKGAGNGSLSYELINPLDLYIDEEYQKATRTVPYMSSLSWLKAIAGRHGKRKVRNQTYSFFEEGQFMKAAATIAAIAANGAMFDITISAADHQNIGGTGKSSFFVEGMTVMFQDGKTTGRINSINRAVDSAHVLTVKKLNSSQDIGTVATVGTVIMGFSNAQTERSGATESRVDQFEKITNKLQMVREFFETSDFEAQSQMRFTTASGKNYMWYDGMEKTAQRFEFQKEAAILLTPESNGLTDKNGKAVQTAFGLIPQIEQHGINLEYFQQPDSADFDEMILALGNNYADKSYFVGHGLDVMIKLKNFLVEFGKQGTGNISFAPFDGGATQALKLNFKSYSVGAYEFYFNEWDILSHKDSLGAKNLPFRHKAIFMPAGQAKNANPERSEGEAAYLPHIQLITPQWGVDLPSGVDQGEYLMWQTGALAIPFPTNDILAKGVHFGAYIGLELHCRHKFAQWDIA